MGFIIVYSTQVGLVLNLVNGSLSLQFHILLDDMLYNVVSITAPDTEVCINLVMSINLRI